MHVLFAQIPDPGTLLTGGNVIIGVCVILGLVALSHSSDIKAFFSKEKEKIDSKIDGAKEKISTIVPGANAADPAFDINEFFLKLESGAMANPVVRKMCSSVCRSMINAAKVLPNKKKAEESHQMLRTLFLEFGDPTPADPEPVVIDNPVDPSKPASVV